MIQCHIPKVQLGQLLYLVTDQQDTIIQVFLGRRYTITAISETFDGILFARFVEINSEGHTF